jgi:hypothetical protein
LQSLRGAQAVSAFNELHAGGFFAGAFLSCADAPKVKAAIADTVTARPMPFRIAFLTAVSSVVVDAAHYLGIGGAYGAVG